MTIYRERAPGEPNLAQAVHDGLVLFRTEGSPAYALLGEQAVEGEIYGAVVQLSWEFPEYVALLAHAIQWAAVNGLAGLLVPTRRDGAEIRALKQGGFSLEVMHAVVRVGEPMRGVVVDDAPDVPAPASAPLPKKRTTKARPASQTRYQEMTDAQNDFASQPSEQAVSSESDADPRDRPARTPRTASGPLITGVQRQFVGPPPTRR